MQIAAEGKENTQIADALGISRQKAGRWREHDAKAGLAGLLRDKPGRGCPARITAQPKTALVRRTLEEPCAEATQWSTRSMAKASGMGATKACNILAKVQQARSVLPIL